MPPVLKAPQVCVDAVVDAFNQYRQLTGQLPLTYAPEAFIQTVMAQHLSQKLAYAKYVTLETSVWTTLTEARARLVGRPFKGAKGRFDLVTWTAQGAPRVVIEVKKLRHRYGGDKDIQRLRQSMAKGGLQQGYLVAYADAVRPHTITDRWDSVTAQTGAVLVARSGLRPFQVSWAPNQTWHYEAACFRV